MSDENQEIIADIVAEIRGAKTEFPFVYLMGEPDTQEVIDAKTKEIIEPRKINIRRVTVNELADRIEAAAKREKVPLGNAAEMCKALFDIVMLTMKVGYSIHGDVAYGIIASKAKHALAAPPRNCDRFGGDGDIDLLRETCLRERGLNPEEDFPEVFCEWLLSKEKGESNGSK